MQTFWLFWTLEFYKAQIVYRIRRSIITVDGYYSTELKNAILPAG